jgi:hypothetical protein
MDEGLTARKVSLSVNSYDPGAGGKLPEILTFRGAFDHTEGR